MLENESGLQAVTRRIDDGENGLLPPMGLARWYRHLSDDETGILCPFLTGHERETKKRSMLRSSGSSLLSLAILSVAFVCLSSIKFQTVQDAVDYLDRYYS